MWVLPALTIEKGTCDVCGETFDGWGLVGQLRNNDPCSHYSGCDLPTEWIIWGCGAYCSVHIAPALMSQYPNHTPHRIGWPVCGDVCLIVLETRILLGG